MSAKVPDPVFEQHMTPQQLAELWAMSVLSVRRLFQHEPGVIVFCANSKENCREKWTMRIPVSVAARVYERLRRGARVA